MNSETHPTTIIFWTSVTLKKNTTQATDIKKTALSDGFFVLRANYLE